MDDTAVQTPAQAAEIRLNLGARIQEARKDAGLSRGELAEKLGISNHTLKQWEHSHREWGRMVGIEQLVQIAEATGKPLSFFLPLDAKDGA